MFSTFITIPTSVLIALTRARMCLRGSFIIISHCHLRLMQKVEKEAKNNKINFCRDCLYWAHSTSGSMQRAQLVLSHKKTLTTLKSFKTIKKTFLSPTFPSQ